MEERPAPIILRPLEIKHLFDFSIRLYRSCFAPMFLSMAIVQLPLSLLTLPIVLSVTRLMTELQQASNTGSTPDMAWLYDHADAAIWIGAGALGSMIWQLLVMPLGHLACARLATLALHGEPCTLLEALAYARKRYWPTQVVLFTFFLPLLLLSILVLLPVLALTYAGDGSGAAGAAGLALLLIFFGSLATLLLFFRFMFAVYGVVQSAEDPYIEGVFAQGLWYLRRSYELSATFFWRLFGLYVLLAVALVIISNGVSQSSQLLVELVRGLIQGNAGAELTNALLAQPDVWTTGISLLISLLIELVFPALVTSFVVLLYFDLRCRKEGYDLLRMLQQDTLAA